MPFVNSPGASASTLLSRVVGSRHARSRRRRFTRIPALGRFLTAACFPRRSSASGQPAAATDRLDFDEATYSEPRPARGFRSWADAAEWKRGPSTLGAPSPGQVQTNQQRGPWRPPSPADDAVALQARLDWRRPHDTRPPSPKYYRAGFPSLHWGSSGTRKMAIAGSPMLSCVDAFCQEQHSGLKDGLLGACWRKSGGGRHRHEVQWPSSILPYTLSPRQISRSGFVL